MTLERARRIAVATGRFAAASCTIVALWCAVLVFVALAWTLRSAAHALRAITPRPQGRDRNGT